MSSSINSTPELYFMSADVALALTQIAAEVKTVTEIMFLIKFLPMMTIQVTRVELNDELNENSPAESITSTSTRVTRAHSNKRKRKDIPTVHKLSLIHI